MSFDDQINIALDRTLSDVRAHLEADLRAFAQEALRAAAEERHGGSSQPGDTDSADGSSDLAAQLEQLESARHHADELRRSAEAQIFELRRSLEDLRTRGQQQLEAARRTADELMRSQLAAAADESDRRMADAVNLARTEGQQAEFTHAERLAGAIAAIDEAGSLGEVLDQLAESAGAEVDRAAVLIVRADRLRGWRLEGFGPSTQAAKAIDLDLDQAGLPGAVARSGEPMSCPAVPAVFGEREPALPPFARDAGQRYAMAFPVIVGGGVVAVLYGDAPRLRFSSFATRWPSILQVLVRHASRALEAMTVQRVAGLDPPPTARASLEEGAP